jgi:glycine cleavage system transcriptional repressor
MKNQQSPAPVGRSRYVLNVVAEDRPGIVSAVSGTIAELAGNIEAVSQTVLMGHFTLIMIVEMSEAVSSEHLRRTVEAAGGDHAFAVLVRPVIVSPPKPVPKGSECFVITIMGDNRPGSVFRFSSYLAEKGVNITDLYGDTQQGRFMLVSQVQVPPQWDIGMLQADLEHLGLELGFTVRMQHENLFVATNELRLRREIS